MNQNFLNTDLAHIVHEQGIGCAVVQYGGKQFCAFFDSAPVVYNELGQLVLSAPELLCYPADVTEVEKGAALSIAATGEPFVAYKVSGIGRQRWGLTVLQLTKDRMNI